MAALVFLVIAVVSIVIGRGGISMPDFDSSEDVHHITGAISPEHEEYFKDPATIKALKERHIELEVDVFSAPDMIGLIENSPKKYDFFMAELDGAAHTLETWDANTVRTQSDGSSKRVFSTPLIALVHSDLVEDMKSHNVVTEENGYETLNLHTLVDLSLEDKRWRDISPAFGSPRAVDVAVPRVTESNAALRYAAEINSVAMGPAAEEVGRDDMARVRERAGEITRLLVADQGYGETTSQGMLDAFLRMGKGEMPMVLTTEAQYLRLVSDGKDMSAYTSLLLSPSASLNSTVVPRTEEGDMMATALGQEPFQEAAAKRGLRTVKPEYFANFAWQHDYDILKHDDEVNPPMWDQYDMLLKELS